MFKDYSIFGLSLLILFEAFSPFRMEKNFTFQIQTEVLVVVTILSWIGITSLIFQERKSYITLIDVVFFAYIAYLLLQLIFYPVDTYYTLTIISLSAAYFLFRHIKIQWFTGLLVLLPVLAVVQIIYGHNRFEYPWQTLSDNIGAFNNTGIFGEFVAMGLVAALGLLLSFRQLTARIAMSVLLMPITVQLICSQSRAAWISSTVGIIVLLIPFFRRLTKRKAVAIISAILIACILFSAKLYHFKKNSADGRLLIWAVSWNMLKEKPLVGFGPGGFRKTYLLRQGDYLKNHPDSPYIDLADDIVYPFNEFLKTGIEQGIIGLLLVFGILFLAFKNTPSPPALRAVLAALVVFSFFSYPFDIVPFQVLGVLCLAGIASTQKSVVISGFTHVSVIPISTRNPLKITAMCLFIMLCGFISFVSCNYFVNVKKWNQFIHSYPFGNEKQITEFQTLYPAFQCNDKFVFVYAKALFDAKRYDEAISLLNAAKELFPSTQTLITLGDAYEKTGEYSKALEVWKTASFVKPILFSPHYKMATLYFTLKDYERARQEANIILNKKIKIDNPEIDRMKQEAYEIMNYKL